MEITSTELRKKINDGEKVIIDFKAQWCGPCKVMLPMFLKAKTMLEEQNSNVQLYVFDVDSDREFVSELGISSVPTIKGFANGEQVFSEIGLKQTNAIIELSKKL